LLGILRTQVELRRALQQTEKTGSGKRLLRAQGRPELVANAPAMQSVLEAITALVRRMPMYHTRTWYRQGSRGPTLHALSHRAQRPIVAVNTGGLSEGVLKKRTLWPCEGAFTDARADRIGRFELADGGTIFLDEIGNVPFASNQVATACWKVGRSSGSAPRGTACRCARDLGDQFRFACPLVLPDSFVKICYFA